MDSAGLGSAVEHWRGERSATPQDVGLCQEGDTASPPGRSPKASLVYPSASSSASVPRQAALPQAFPLPSRRPARISALHGRNLLEGNPQPYHHPS